MNISRKWGTIAGAVVVSVGLLAGGAVYAASAPDQTAQPQAVHKDLDQAVKDGKLSQGQADVMKQLHELRQTYRQKYEADAKSVVDQAVKAGKLTQDQAEKMLQHGRGFGGHKGKMHGPRNMTPEQMKSRLDEAVKSGKLTQEQADKVLKNWTDHQNKKQ